MAGLGRSGPVRGSAGGEVLVIVSPHFAPGSTPLRGFLCIAPIFRPSGVETKAARDVAAYARRITGRPGGGTQAPPGGKD